MRKAHTSEADKPATMPESTAASSHTGSASYTEEEMEQVRQVLAENGYPDPSPEDIAQVLRHVQLYLHASSSVPASEADLPEPHFRDDDEDAHARGDPIGAGRREDEDEMLPRAASADVAGEPRLHSVRRFAGRAANAQPPHKSARPRRPVLQAAWDDSTQVVHSRVQGPHFPASRSPPRRHTSNSNNKKRGSAAALQPAHTPAYLLSGEPAARGRWAGAPRARDVLFAVPPALRLERHVRRHARTLATELYAEEEGGEHGAANESRHRPARSGTPSSTSTAALLRHKEEEEEEKGAVPANVLTDRRSANVIFNMTGDRRYRFRPTTTASPAEATIIPAQPFKSSYNAQSTSRRRGQAFSTYSVSYLDAEGSTLRAKADPVARGAQMRLLWSRDRFLTQRDRPAEVWRTRQVMMSVDTSLI